jgi:hypothetical protein
LINLPWGERLFNTSLVSLLRNTSDHVPLMVSASSRAPVSQTFRYERSWGFSADYRASIAEVWARPQNCERRLCSRTPIVFSQMG